MELGQSEAAKTWERAAEAALNAQFIKRSTPGGYSDDWPWARIALAEVAKSQLKMGEKGAALVTYRKAVETQEGFEALRGRIIADKAIAKGFGLLGAFGDARTVAERADREMVGVGLTPTNPMHARYVPGLWVAAQEYEAAFGALDKLASELPEKKPNVRALLDIGEMPDFSRSVFFSSAIDDMASMTEGTDPAKVRPFLVELAHRMEPLGNGSQASLEPSPLLEAFARVGDIGRARQMALACEDPSSRLQAFLTIARQQRLDGDLDGASKTVAEGLKPAEKMSRFAGLIRELPLPLNEAINELINQGNLHQAVTVAQDLPAGKRYNPIRSIALASKRAGDEDRAKALFGEALADAVLARKDPPISDFARRLYEKNGRLDEELSDERDAARRAIAGIQAQLGRFDEARKTAESISEPVSRCRAIQEVVAAEAEKGRAAEAFAWVQEIEIPWGKTEVLTTLALWAKARPQPVKTQPPTPAQSDQSRQDAPAAQDEPKPDQARLDLIRETLAARKASDIPLTTEEQRAVARSLVRLGDRPGAWAFLRQEAEHADRPGMFVRSASVRIARVQREAGDQEGALASYRRAARDEANARPDPQQIYDLSTIAREFSELGSEEDARDAARRCVEEVGRFEKPEERRSFIPYIADCWAGARDIDRAFAVLDAIELPFGAESEARRLRAEGLARMAESYPQDDRPAARDAYARIEAEAGQGLEAAERDGVRAAVARGLAGIGEVDPALRMARSIGDEARPEPHPALERAKAIQSLYRAIARLPEPERRAARSLLGPSIREALDLLLAMDLPTIEVSLLSSMGMTLASLENFESALKAAEALPPGHRVVLLQVIAIGQQRAGDAQASRDTFQKALDDIEYRRTHPGPPKQGRPPVTPDQEAAFRIADTRAMQGDFEGARKVAMTIETPDSRWRALGHVVAMQAQRGEGQAALEWCRANPAPRGVPDPMEALLINLSFFRSDAE